MDKRSKSVDVWTAEFPLLEAYATFITFLTSLRDELPGRLDGSVMRTMSGARQTARHCFVHQA